MTKDSFLYVKLRKSGSHFSDEMSKQKKKSENKSSFIDLKDKFRVN